MRIGVLALQGAFIEHQKMYSRLGVETLQVRKPEHLQHIDGLILPGGESSVMWSLMGSFELRDAVGDFAAVKPVWGICAGSILLAEGWLNIMNIRVERNAYGRHRDSFMGEIQLEKQLARDKAAFQAIFIRAPKIRSIGPEVEILANYNDEPVLLRQCHILSSSFHPELTADDRIHRYFLKLCKRKKAKLDIDDNL